MATKLQIGRSYKEDSLFAGSTIDVARRLIGAILIRILPPGVAGAGTQLAGRIVETEAYLPLIDPACHGFRGPTGRNSSIFGRAGHAYVYFIYGNHFCFNVTTERAGIGGAVLVRALEPIEGIDAMRRRRPHAADERLLSGPGNLCRAMEIDRSLDGADLARDPRIRIEIDRPKSTGAVDGHSRIIVSSRVGLREAAKWPLRFYEASSRSVSKRAP